MLPDTVRLGQSTKDQLLRLKRATGIKQWNVLCRFAICYSLADPRALPTHEDAASNVEISWKVLTGAHAHTYEGLLETDAIRRDVNDLGHLLHAHLRRGVSAMLLLPPNLSGLVTTAHPSPNYSSGQL